MSRREDHEVHKGHVVAMEKKKIYIYIYICSLSGTKITITTGYGLDGPGIESLWGARFFSPVQTDPGAHLASCTMSTGSFAGVNSGRGVTLSPHPLLVPWSRKSRAIPLLPFGPYDLYRASVPVQGCTFTFTFFLQSYIHFIYYTRHFSKKIPLLLVFSE